MKQRELYNGIPGGHALRRKALRKRADELPRHISAIIDDLNFIGERVPSLKETATDFAHRLRDLREDHVREITHRIKTL